MANPSKDKLSPSPDFNSPDKSSRSVEEPELVQLEKSLLKRTLPKLTPKALLADIMPTKKKEKILPILKDSKF